MGVYSELVRLGVFSGDTEEQHAAIKEAVAEVLRRNANRMVKVIITVKQPSKKKARKARGHKTKRKSK